MPCRPNADATMAVVPVPPNGSSTRAGVVGASGVGQAQAVPVIVTCFRATTADACVRLADVMAFPALDFVCAVWLTCSYSASHTGRRPSPQRTHTPLGDQPNTSRRGHSDGNAAKCCGRSGGSSSGSVATSHTEPGSLPSDPSTDPPPSRALSLRRFSTTPAIAVAGRTCCTLAAL
jgi:hypothetical protein